MDFFIANAWAQTQTSRGAGLLDFLPLILLVVIFYMMLIRPQMKKQKEHRNMVEGLAKGDEAVTNGGLLGRITKVGDSFVVMEVAKNVEVKVQKHQIGQVMPKGTLKTL